MTTSPDAGDDRFGPLMQRAQQGDEQAYAELLRTIAPRIRQIVRTRRRGIAAEHVEDLTQEILMSVHTARATYDVSRPFGPWLSAIAKHRLADAARQHARQGAHEVAVADPAVTFADRSANSPAAAFGETETLAEAIRVLPAGQRQAIELLKLQELSLKEAAAVTGLSTGALKLATHRAMTALRRVMRRTEHS